MVTAQAFPAKPQFRRRTRRTGRSRGKLDPAPPGEVIYLKPVGDRPSEPAPCAAIQSATTPVTTATSTTPSRSAVMTTRKAAYSSRGIRTMLRERGITAVMPQPSDQIRHRTHRGSASLRATTSSPPSTEEPSSYAPSPCGWRLRRHALVRHAYRHGWAQVGHPAEAADIAVAVHGFVAADDRQAKASYLDHELRMFSTGAADIGRVGLPPTGRGTNYEAGGMVFAGGPNEIADRLLTV
jgi:hypothetical protein